MRTFGTDSPQFFAFKIEGHDEIFKMPLASSLPLGKVLELDDGTAEEQIRRNINLFKEYIGDVIYELPAGVFVQIVEEWKRTTADSGAELGE